MSYRPEGWKNPFTKEHGNLSPVAEMETNIYESGADAMLEALRKGDHSYGAIVLRPDNITPIHGTFAFIPDDQESKP